MTPVYYAAGVSLFGRDPFTEREVDPGFKTFVNQLVRDLPPERIYDALTLSDDERSRRNEKKLYPRELRHEVARIFVGGLAPTPYNPEIATQRAEEEHRKSLSSKERWQEDRKQIVVAELGGEDRTLEQTLGIYRRYAEANGVELDDYLLESFQNRERVKQLDLDAKFPYKDENERPLEHRELDQVKALNRLNLLDRLYPQLDDSWVSSERRKIANAPEKELESLVSSYEYELGFSYLREWNEVVNQWLEERATRS